MKMKKGLLLVSLMPLASFLSAQAADTASLAYKTGYQIGSWLPFSIIVLLAVLVLLKASRQYRDK